MSTDTKRTPFPIRSSADAEAEAAQDVRRRRRLRRQGHPGPRGPRPGAQAAGHVHRLHRSGRPAPPHLGGRRQLGRRGDGRLTATASASRSLADGGCRVDDNGRGIPVDPYPSGPHKGKSAAEVVLTVLHAGGKFGGEGYKVSGGLHGVGVVGRQRAVRAARSSRSTATASAGSRSTRRAASRRARWPSSVDTPARGRTTGTTVTFWPDPTIFAAEGTEFVARTVLERLQTMAFLNSGLEIVFTDERPGREQEADVPVQGWHRRLREAPQRLEGAVVLQGVRTSRTTTRTARCSTSRCSGTPATTRASTATPTASPPSRAACTSRASGRR